MILLKDGASIHLSDAVHVVLEQEFGKNFFASASGSLENGERLGLGWDWPPNLPDLTPLNFAIWSVLKKQVTKNAVPSSMRELQLLIRRVWSESMTVDYIRKCCTYGVQHRVDAMLLAEGGRFE